MSIDPLFLAACAYAEGHPVLGPSIAALRSRLSPQTLEERCFVAAAVPEARVHVFRPAIQVHRADARARALKAAADGVTWDLIIVGAGLSGAAVAAAYRVSAPGARVMVVDAACRPSPFSLGGAAYRLNTWSTGKLPTGDLRDGADQNPTAAAPVAWWSGARFPSADVLSDASELSLHLSGADLLMPCTVVRVEPAFDGAPHRVQADVEGLPLTLLARAVVVATGLGRRSLPFSDPDTRRYLEDQIAAVDAQLAAGQDVHPEVAGADQICALSEASPDALAYFRGPGPIAVLGAGPSALSLLAVARQLGPLPLYDGPGRYARASESELAPIWWVTGEGGPSTAREAARQLQLDAVKPNTMGAVMAEAYAQLGHELVNAEARGLVSVLAGRVVSCRRSDQGHALVVEGREAPIEARRVVIATGLENGLEQAQRLVGGGLEWARLAAAPSEPLWGVYGARGAPEVYLCGAALEHAGEVSEARGPLAEWLPRAQALGRWMATREPNSTKSAIAAAADPTVVQLGAVGHGGALRLVLGEAGALSASAVAIEWPWWVLLALLAWRYAAPRIVLRCERTRDGLDLKAQGLSSAELWRVFGALAFNPQGIPAGTAIDVDVAVLPGGAIDPGSVRVRLEWASDPLQGSSNSNAPADQAH